MGDFLTYIIDRWGKNLENQLIDPESRGILPHIRIMVNGQTIDFLEGPDTQLQEGDEVLILPQVSGG